MKNGVVILCVKEMLVGEYKLVLSTKLGGSTHLDFYVDFSVNIYIGYFS